MPDFRAAELARQGQTEMALPRGMLDPLFLCELALELGLSVTELMHGRGTPMTIHELTVTWPAFWAYRARDTERQLAEQERSAKMQRSRI